jgi:carbamoyl-phosphate synthase large subunit
MVNSNPETVSTDYDTSDQLFFEPLTRENVLDICDRIRPHGVILQFGGQTPLNLARALGEAGVPILGTSPDSIDLAEDRKRFAALLSRLGLMQPPSGIATNDVEAREIASRVGYPVMVRPSYVLGGRAMEIVGNESLLKEYLERAVSASPEHPVLVDKFLDEAVEVDVDAVADGQDVVVAGIMEHIEMAGVHSGDSTCIMPPNTLSAQVVQEITEQTRALAHELKVVGLMNIQFAVKNEQVYVIEVNPRASRTVPFVSKAVGIPIAKIAAMVMVGKTLRELGVTDIAPTAHHAVKAPVFPFRKFPGSDVILGPEMRSTGEVMGIDHDLGTAVAKAQLGAGNALPASGKILLSVRDADKRQVVSIARRLSRLPFRLVATRGTHAVLRQHGIEADLVMKIGEGRPDVTDVLKNRDIALIINTPSGPGSRTDEARIRSLAVMQGIPVVTTIAGAQASVSGIEALIKSEITVRALQDYYEVPGAELEVVGREAEG